MTKLLTDGDEIEMLKRRVADLETMLVAIYRAAFSQDIEGTLNVMVMRRLDIAIAVKHVQKRAQATRQEDR
jgi:hypothetical protein